MNNITRSFASFLSMTFLLTGLMISPVYAEESVADDWIPLSTNEEESKDAEEQNNFAEIAYKYVDINNVNDLATALGTGSVTILSATDLTLTQNIVFSNDTKALRFISGVYNIDFNGFTISESVFVEIYGGNVSLKDSSVAQTGGIDTRNSLHGDIFDVYGGDLTILSGVYLSKNNTVAVWSGTFALKGGTIRVDAENGQGVHVETGTLNMSGGLIESWSGVALYEGSVGIISGGNIIAKHTGVALSEDSVCTISGGKVVSEQVAIGVFDTTLSISGGEFIGGMAGLFNGPLTSKRIVSLTGGKFINDPTQQGGGIMVTSFSTDYTENVETYLSSGSMFIPSTITEEVWKGNGLGYLYSHTVSTVTVVSRTSVEGFVNRLYTKALGRNPDPTGFAEWVSQLKAKQISGAKAAYGFFFSPEIINRNLPDSDFIKLLYNVFFDRAPDTAGLSYWLSALESGASRQYVFAGFANSQEWKSLCGTYAIDPGSYNSDEARDQNIKVTSFVQRLYTLCLNRKADVPGLNDWTASLNSKQKDGAHVAYGFFFSPEFKNQNLSNENYVEILYQVLLGRASDSAGKADWVAQLKAGKDRLDVFRGFVHSKEFDAICASYGITRGTI